MFTNTEIPPLLWLPLELYLKIFLYLDFVSIVRFSALNKTSVEIARHPIFWKKKFADHFGTNDNQDVNNWYQEFVNFYLEEYADIIEKQPKRQYSIIDKFNLIKERRNTFFDKRPLEIQFKELILFKDSRGRSALDWALILQHQPILNDLYDKYLKGGANCIGVGQTHTWLAANCAVLCLQPPSTIEFRCAGLDFTQMAQTPLHTAAQFGHQDYIPLLLKLGIDIDQTTAHPFVGLGAGGQTALHLACEYGHLKAAELLINLGANVNSNTMYTLQTDGTTERSITPLHAAVRGNHWAIVVLLLKRGANLFARNNKLETTLDLAINLDHENIVNLFVEFLQLYPRFLSQDDLDQILYNATSSKKTKYLPALIFLGANPHRGITMDSVQNNRRAVDIAIENKDQDALKQLGIEQLQPLDFRPANYTARTNLEGVVYGSSILFWLLVIGLPPTIYFTLHKKEDTRLIACLTSIVLLVLCASGCGIYFRHKGVTQTDEDMKNAELFIKSLQPQQLTENTPLLPINLENQDPELGIDSKAAKTTYGSSVKYSEKLSKMGFLKELPADTGQQDVDEQESPQYKG